MIPAPEWVWHGTAGHFIGSPWCCFRLHTTVGEYRISTVGCYHSLDDPTPRPIGSAATDLYETYVFRNGPDGEVISWEEIDGKRYATEAKAEIGHMEFCRQYAAGVPA